MKGAANSDDRTAALAASDTDRALLLEWIAGNQQAGADFVARHALAIRRSLHRLVRGARGSVVDDAFQDTFLVSFQQARRRLAVSAVERYLVAIAQNSAKAIRRRRQVTVPFETALELELQDDGNEALFRHADGSRVVGAVQGLSPKLRNVIELRYWAELHEEEVAARLGISRATVASRLRRALERLRIQLR